MHRALTTPLVCFSPSLLSVFIITAAQLQPSRGEGHTCYDAAAPHFHTLPHEKLDSVLGSSATALIESPFFVVDVYLDPLDLLVLVTVVAGSEDIALNAGDDMPVNVP